MKKRLLPITLLVALGLVACTPTTSSSQPGPSSSSEESSSSEQYTLSISNETELTDTWYVNDANRAIELEYNEPININSAIADGDLVITSSDATVVGVSGKFLLPLGEGSSDVTVAYAGLTDTVTINVLADIDFDASLLELITGDSAELNITLSKNGVSSEIVWASADENIATIEVDDDKLSATVTGVGDGATTVSATYKGKTINATVAVSSFEVGMAEYPIDGKEYKFGFYQGTIEKQLYFTGELNEKGYGLTTEIYDDAADILATAVTGGWTLSVGEKYLALTDAGKFTMADTATTWQFNTEYSTFTSDVAGTTYYMGTYSSYDTMSASKISYAATSFVGHIYCYEEISETRPVDAGVYKFGFYQGTIEKQLYFTGELNEKGYGLTTEIYDDAADILATAVTGGWTLSVGEKYLALTDAGKFTMADTATTWQFNTEYSTFTSDVAGTTYYMGTYSSYDTMSASKISYAATSFVGHIYEVRVPGLAPATPVEPEPEEPTDPEVTLVPELVETAPVAGTEYVFAMNQTSLSKILYATGEMSGFYGATTEDPAEAAVAVVEEVTGGYNLKVGTKYVNAKVSDDGQHLNYTYGATAETVWTYNSEYNTLITDLEGTTVYTGTYGTHNTFGVSDIKHIATSYPGRFYTLVEGEPEEPGDSEEPGTPVTPVDGIVFDWATATQESYSTEQAVYSSNGVTITNDKASSTTNIRDCKTSGDKSLRLYKGSNVTIECEEEFTSLVITFEAANPEYGNPENYYCLSAGTYGDVTATLNGLVGTWTFESTTSLTITGLANQIRVVSMVVVTAE